jgi:protein TonB
VSPARWQARLASHLERRKRYPSAARRQGQQGTAQVRFTIDGSGNVQSVSLVRSSGVALLDEEVVALVRRASPVPAPPPGVNRTIVVPIRFSVR